MKYLFISHGGFLHGGEICLLESVMALKANSECEVHILISDNTVELQNELESVGAIVHNHIPNAWWVGKKKTFREYLFMIKQSIYAFKMFRLLLETVKPDYVITNTIVSNPIFSIASRFKKIKTIWYIHELGDKDHQYTYYLGKNLTFFLVKLFSHTILFNSQFTLSHFTKKQSKKFKVIEYAVSYRINDTNNLKVFPENKDKWEILIAGRTFEGKGQIDLVNAIRILKTKYHVNNMHLNILGAVENDYTDNLLKISNENQLNESITFIPFNSDVTDLFRNADIGITTSRNEAFGRITVEYMKYGLITIGADAGATKYIIENNRNGLLYKVGDSEELASILFNIQKGYVKIDELRQNAWHDSFEKYNLKRHYEALISSIN